MAQLSVLWQNQTRVSVDKKILISHLEDILRRLKRVGRVEIEVTLVGDSSITKLKQQFIGQNEPTDVLSFAASSEIRQPSVNQSLIGSIVVSVETATRQATEAGIELTTELKMLTGHGLLHLLGYHHE